LRAKFIAEGAIIKGMKKENIFSFNTPEEAGISLQNEIKEGDLILIDGSKELAMEKIIKEIQFTPLENLSKTVGI
jgi:UDP-N-acetylmuramyl pentapeptide synthase